MTIFNITEISHCYILDVLYQGKCGRKVLEGDQLQDLKQEGQKQVSNIIRSTTILNASCIGIFHQRLRFNEQHFCSQCSQYRPCPRKVALHFILFGWHCAMHALSSRENFPNFSDLISTLTFF